MRQLDGSPKEKFVQVLRAIIRAGNDHPFRILVDDKDYLPTMPEVMPAYHLLTILIKPACVRSSMAALMKELAQDLSDNELRREFVASYFELRMGDVGHRSRRSVYQGSGVESSRK